MHCCEVWRPVAGLPVGARGQTVATECMWLIVAAKWRRLAVVWCFARGLWVKGCGLSADMNAARFEEVAQIEAKRAENAPCSAGYSKEQQR